VVTRNVSHRNVHITQAEPFENFLPEGRRRLCNQRCPRIFSLLAPDFQKFHPLGLIARAAGSNEIVEAVGAAATHRNAVIDMQIVPASAVCAYVIISGKDDGAHDLPVGRRQPLSVVSADDVFPFGNSAVSGLKQWKQHKAHAAPVAA
jgi:hypothetical protein